MKEIKVENAQKRIDKYLSEILDESRSVITKMIDEGFILVNNQKVKASKSLKENDLISIQDGFKIDCDIKPADIPLNIVFEDENVILINKQSGLTVHPGSGNYDNTMVNALMYYTNNLSDISGDERPGIVHRIDKDTSGLILVAKNNKSHQILAEDFKNKRIKREYIALINGVFPHNKATIDAPIGRDETDRKKMTVTDKNSKKAITHLTVLKRYKDYTLVSLILDTGRTHQIRVHMKYIGYPIYNDPVYSNKKATEFGQFLHSYKINFEEPITKEKLEFIAPLPKEFQNFLNTLEEL